MKITICGSTKFYDRIPEIKKELEAQGHEVLTPSLTDYHHLEEDALAKVHYQLIKDHFRKIESSDAVLILNFEKNGINNYIGGNTLIEMAKAFDIEIPIYILNDIPRELSYKEEILAMQPITLNGNLNKINQ